ncbi:MAG: glycosyltransferase family 4 protein [Oscillospiraceae bacterium]|nr:glycosyltransferase family 4 protein [Oscillospiraceae bacterium]
MKEKIAFVVQRYGEEVIGGSESECRMYAERLTPYYDVEVITTCAIDHLTWRNDHAPGVSTLHGVTVRRFPVSRERDLGRFFQLSQQLTAKGSGRTEEEIEEWLRVQGPVADGAIDYLCEHAGEYKVVLFMTYLFYLTAVGLPRFPGRSILIPTAHDEWSMYFACYREIFEYARGFVYNSEAEHRFVDSLFLETAGKPSITIGAGVEYPAGLLPDIRERFGITRPYVLYCGRVEGAKGCDRLIDYFAAYKRRFGGELMLVLTGKVDMPLPQREDLLALGFVSEEEKYALMASSVAFALASQFESLSIVVLESLMMGRPVLVNGECEVLRDHAVISKAGLWFRDADEFCGALRYLLTHPAEYAQMCENGRRYVAERYNWSAILARLRGLIELVSAEE